MPAQAPDHSVGERARIHQALLQTTRILRSLQGLYLVRRTHASLTCSHSALIEKKSVSDYFRPE